MQLSDRIFKIVGSTVLATIALQGGMLHGVTREIPVSTVVNARQNLLKFFWQKRGDYPDGRRRGGATQSFCPPTRGLKELIALIPLTEEGLTAIALTSSDSPTFWFYVPPAASGAPWSVEFVLYNKETEEDIYVTPDDFRLSEESGIVGFQLPKNVQPLTRNTQYEWVFSIVCNSSDRSGDMSVRGLVERVSEEEERAIERELQAAETQRERFSIYSKDEHGLWYDALTSLARYRQQNPRDREGDRDWKALLESVGLGEIASEPLTDCCQLEALSVEEVPE